MNSVRLASGREIFGYFHLLIVILIRQRCYLELNLVFNAIVDDEMGETVEKLHVYLKKLATPPNQRLKLRGH